MRLSTETETGGHDYGKRSTYLGLGILLGCVFTLTALCFRGTEELVKQSYSTFAPLDGKFDSNVILQIKNGPVRFACALRAAQPSGLFAKLDLVCCLQMDFQIREPLHPLLGAMKKTNVMMAVQAAQECRRSNSLCVFFFLKEAAGRHGPADPCDEPRHDVGGIPGLRYAPRRPGIDDQEAPQQHLHRHQARPPAPRPHLGHGLRFKLRLVCELGARLCQMPRHESLTANEEGVAIRRGTSSRRRIRSASAGCPGRGARSRPSRSTRSGRS